VVALLKDVRAGRRTSGFTTAKASFKPLYEKLIIKRARLPRALLEIKFHDGAVSMETDCIVGGFYRFVSVDDGSILP